MSNRSAADPTYRCAISARKLSPHTIAMVGLGVFDGQRYSIAFHECMNAQQAPLSVSATWSKHRQEWLRPKIMVQVEDPSRLIDHRSDPGDLSCVRTIVCLCFDIF